MTTTRWLYLTEHAAARMQSRRISEDDIETVIQYGRTIYARKTVFKIIGRKEIRRYRDQIDLSRLDGVHVVCANDGNLLTVVTVYRRRNFRPRDFYPAHRQRRRKSLIGR